MCLVSAFLLKFQNCMFEPHSWLKAWGQTCWSVTVIWAVAGPTDPLVWPCDRGWARQHRCSCCLGWAAQAPSGPGQHFVCPTAAHSAVCAQSPLHPPGLGHCAAERTVLCFGETQTNTSFKKNKLTKPKTKTHEIFHPLFICSHHRQYPEKS